MLPDTIEARAEFAKIMQFVSRSITGAALDDDVLEAYWFVLAEEFDTTQELGNVAKKLLSYWSFGYMPKPAHFIEAKKSAANLEEIAHKAYNTAKSAAIHVGVYENIEFGDPFIAETILTLFGSWKEFHDKVAYFDSDDTWVKKDFIDAYKRIARAGKVRDAKLMGYLKSDFKDPKLIACDYEAPKAKIQERPAIASSVLRKLPNKRVANG